MKVTVCSSFAIGVKIPTAIKRFVVLLVFLKQNIIKPKFPWQLNLSVLSHFLAKKRGGGKGWGLKRLV